MSGYSKEYYDECTDMNYHNEEKWEPLFRRFAEHIYRDISPKSVLDVGCAFGYMVKYLRELGIEAWGIDTSKYAIEQADENIKPYVFVASGCEELPDKMPKKYDLVINIEVAEHLSAEDGRKLICQICTYSDTVLFSSTGEDINNPSHINVQQPEYWAQIFADQGFYKKLDYSMEYLSKYAFMFERQIVPHDQLVFNYEHNLRYMRYCYENEQRTSSRLVKDIEDVRKMQADDEKYFRNEIERLTKEATAYIEQITKIEGEKSAIANEIGKLTKEANAYTEQITKIEGEKSAIANEVDRLTKEATAYTEQLAKIEDEKSALEDKESYLSGEVRRLEKIISELTGALNNEKNTVKAITEERDRYYTENLRQSQNLDNIMNSRGFKVLRRCYRIRDILLPAGSNRRWAVKKIANKLFKRSSLSLAANNVTPPEIKPVSIYTPEETARHDQCRNTPIETNIKFSIVVPVYNVPAPVFQAMIFSVKDQIYPDWELCIADASTDRKDLKYLVEQLSMDCADRIKYISIENKGISLNTIEAIKMATGTFIVLLDHDDIIAPNALYEYADVLNKDPDVDFIYSDKDMIDEKGINRVNPLYKPDYSPEIMYSANYFTHLCAMRKTVLEQTEGYDQHTDGAQDWDIFLKMMEKTDKIAHVDKILYHWRIISTSVASGVQAKPYALDAQLLSIRNYIAHKQWQAEVYFNNREKSEIKVDWKFKENITCTAICLSESGNKKISCAGCREIIPAKKGDKNLLSIVKKVTSDTVIFIDADAVISCSKGMVKELSAWAMHPEIGFVAPQLRTGQEIVSCGLVYNDKHIMDMFGGKPIGFYGQMGHSAWYRNFSLFRDTCLAVEKVKFEKYCKYFPEFGSMAISAGCFALLSGGYRNVYDHYAYVSVDRSMLPGETELSQDFNLICREMNISPADPYFNIHCTIDVNRPSVQPKAAAEIDKYSSDALALADIYQFSQEDINNNKKIVSAKYNDNVKKMVWFLQEFDYVFYAGLYTIFRTASYLQEKHGIKHTFVFIANASSKVMMERVSAGFPELGKCEAYSIPSMDRLADIPSSDAAVCTLWTTAYYMLKYNKTKYKFYFIQDYEPLFYPGGSTYAQAEATYRFGFKGIANTQGLKNVYEKEYGGQAVSLDPSVDTSIFYPDKNRDYEKKVYTVFFYGRPGHPRNGFELGAAAMKCLKKRMGDKVRIVTAGAEYDTAAYGLEGVLENLGRLKIEQTGDLYRKCDAGLVMMYTRHPSYLPYEMMACGCCVISNYNAYTTWFLKDGVNSVVCEASAENIAESIEGILQDTERRRKIGEQGANEIINNNPDWDTSLEKVAQFVMCPNKEPNKTFSAKRAKKGHK